MSILLAFIFALSSLSMPALNASLDAPAHTHEALLAPRIEAPAQATLKPTEVEVTTTPAPKAPAQALPQAPAQQVSPLPKGAPIDQSEAPKEATASPTVPSQAPTVQCEEDMPCWDCSENDDRECIDGKPVEATVEVGTATDEDSAWMSLESLGEREVPAGMKLEYVGTVTTEPTPAFAQFHVMDTERENVWHIFQYVLTYDA